MPDIFLIYEKQFSFNFTACGGKRVKKNVSYLNLSWFFQFQRLRWGSGKEMGQGKGQRLWQLCPLVVLEQVQVYGEREKGEGEPFGPRRFRFLLLNVRTNFYEYCVCFVVVVVVDVGWYNLPVSPSSLLFLHLLLSLPFPFIQAFYDFLPFFLLSLCSFLHALCSWKFGKLRLIALFSATPTTSLSPLCVLLLFVIVVCLCHASLSHCPSLAWLIFSIAMQKLFLCTVENF